MAFNYLSNLINSQPINDDLESNFDEEIGPDDESDVEFVYNNENEGSQSGDDSEMGLDLDDDDGTRPESGAGGSGNNFQWQGELHDVEVNMYTHRPGPILVDTNLTYESNPIDFVELFLPPSFYDLCAHQSNLYAEQKGAPSSFRNLEPQDIRTFLYVNMMFGIHKMPYYRMYWSLDRVLRVSAVADVISRTRYEEICRYIHLTDSTKTIPRGQPGYDPLYKIRPLINCVHTASEQYYYPGAALSFDEAMIPFSGRLSFKQYIKGKPTPWGVKVWCCAEPSTGYLCNFSFYTGKADYSTEKGLGHHVVWSLGRQFLDRNHHFYYNFFSSVQLTYDLLQRSTYSCGTIRTNRKFWPSDFKNVSLDNGEIKFRQEGNIVATIWKDKRQIALLSTNSCPTVETVQRRAKGGPVSKDIPNAVGNYNANMGGVDLNDQLRTYYPIGRKSVKWWRCCFFYLLEVAVLNAYIIYKKTPRPEGSQCLSHFQFHLEVAKALMSVSTRKRSAPEVPMVRGLVTLDSSKHKRVRLPGRKKQCYNCRTENIRTDSGKRPETVYGCSLCHTHLCDELCFARFHQNIL